MKDTIYTQNRELSWLRFNERVLEEAREKDVPAFEKLKFISIFTSNLDEFFMIRVGSLYDQTFLPKPQIDNKTGMDAAEQLSEIFRAVAPLYKKRDKIYREVAGLLCEKRDRSSADGESYGRGAKLCRKILHSRYASGFVPADHQCTPSFPASCQ